MARSADPWMSKSISTVVAGDEPPFACSTAHRKVLGLESSLVLVTTRDDRSCRRSIISQTGRRAIHRPRRSRGPDLLPVPIVLLSTSEAFAVSATLTRPSLPGPHTGHRRIDDLPMA